VVGSAEDAEHVRNTTKEVVSLRKQLTSVGNIAKHRKS
jgi:hypothetical protein